MNEPAGARVHLTSVAGVQPARIKRSPIVPVTYAGRVVTSPHVYS